MQRDLQLRAAARAIYDACYPSEDWAPVGFDDAERFKKVPDLKIRFPHSAAKPNRFAEISGHCRVVAAAP